MAGIRNSLEHDMARALRGVAKGSPRFQEIAQHLIRRFVIDLASIKRLVPKLANLNAEIFFELVDFWQVQGNQPSTIQRKISLLRKLMSSKDLVPTNAELGIKYSYRKEYIAASPIQLDDISNETVKEICSLQYHFGLKKTEAIHFCLLSCEAGKILVSRKIAYNNKNRYIPIISNEQEEYVKHFASKYPSGFISKAYANRLLSLLHCSELEKLGIDDSEYFRYCYLENRNQQLMTDGLSKLQRLKQLRMELGYRRNVQIKEILQCHTKL